MSTILQSHTIFKPGAVLSHSDLNGIVDYLEEQDRITRRNLNGTGIIRGLEVEYSATEITINPGAAVLPGGQWIELKVPCVFGYTVPTALREEMRNEIGGCYEVDSVVELVDVAGEGTIPFSNQGEGRCVFLYAEELQTSGVKQASCIRQDDVNEIGKINIRFFLGTKVAAVEPEPGVILECFSTPCLPKLSGADIARMNTQTAFNQVLGEKIKVSISNITAAYTQIAACFPELFCGNPFAGDSLEWLNEHITTPHPTYVYDYLKVLFAAYEEFIRTDYVIHASKDEARHYCPNILGLGNGGNHCEEPDACRDYWKPALKNNAEQREEAAFYARRILALTNAANVDFGAISSSNPIQLTPSLSDAAPLSERAIPFYFNISNIRSQWNYRRWKEGTTSGIPHYSDDLCGSGRSLCYTPGCDFVRLEGHVGMPLSIVLNRINSCRQHLNLPFEVIALKVDAGQMPEYPSLSWQPHFCDLEMAFQGRWSYFLALFDAPEINYGYTNEEETQLNSVIALLESNCYGHFDYSEVVRQFQVIIDTDTAFSAQLRRYANFLNGLKIIWRAKLARTRQFLLHNFAACHPGLKPQCGTSKGGTLVLLYADAVAEGNQETLLPIVIGDFTFPCCAIDWTKVPVAVFSVNIRSRFAYVAEGGATPIVVASLRNLSLNAETVEWLVEERIVENDVVSWNVVTVDWTLSENCNNLSRVFVVVEQALLLQTYRATLTVTGKCGRQDIYSEEFTIENISDGFRPGDNPNIGLVARPEATRPAVAQPAREARSVGDQKNLIATLRRRQETYKASISRIEKDKAMNDNAAFNQAKLLVFFTNEATLIENYANLLEALRTAEPGNKKVTGYYRELLEVSTGLVMDKMVLEAAPLASAATKALESAGLLLAEKEVAPTAFANAWKAGGKKENAMPEGDPAVIEILKLFP
ncbi:MAG: hypothetical protein ACKV1O_02400 [Saprospiraceae bacterium]